jgi:group I intron endonuclease
MTPVGSIYVVTNTATREQYVGLTRKTVQKRWDAHKRTASCKKSKHYKLHIALQQHGDAVFTVAEVFVAFDTDALCAAEMQLIAEYAPAYNSSLGGAGLRLKTFSDEYRKKRSDAAKARWANPEWKAKTVAALRAAHNTDAAKLRGKRLSDHNGPAIRWAGHVKPTPPVKDKSASIKASWDDPTVRARRIQGILNTSATAESKTRRSRASTGRVFSADAIARSAQSKWKPLYCPELGLSFLCGKYAAEYFGVLHTSVSNAVRQKGRLLRKYSLERVT